jgi:transposase
VFYLLEAAGFETWLVNAKDVKHLPGRPKTDKLDAVWLGKVAERQMLRPSFVPPPQIRQLRDLTRYRADLVRACTAEKQRAEKLLEDAQIKLSVVATDIFGVSGRDMMAALVAGERNPTVLAQLARRTLRKKITLLEEAFTGHFTGHHAFLLGKMLARVDAISGDVAALDARIEEQIAPFAETVARLDEIPGISLVAAHVILAEIGTDMIRFPTAGHLVSWARLAPGVKESAGKKKGKSTAGHGTPTSLPCSETPPQAPPRPTHSSASGTGASPGAAAPSAPTSRSAAPSWSSPGTCSLTLRPGSPTWGQGSTPPASTPSAASAATSASSKPSATKSPSSPPPDQPNHIPAPPELPHAH